MNKAFIFDMDGVIVDSEKVWDEQEADFLVKLLGQDISEKLGNTTGMGLTFIHEVAQKLGSKITFEDFKEASDKMAFSVYDRASLTPGIEKLAEFLLGNNFKLGLVTGSSKSWIDKVIPKLSFKDRLTILSIGERPDLKHKPSPDGYLEMMEILSTTPETTIILEDSNFGIQAGLASGAFTIALSQNLTPGYKQEKANANCRTLREVVEVIKKERKDLL